MGFVVGGSFWAAATILWLAVVILIRSPSQHRADLQARCVWHGVLFLPLAAGTGYWLGWMGIGFAALVFLIPFTHDVLTLLEEASQPANYARAIGQMRFGRYDDAEMAVIGELERHEDDFEGWMMLAELYAVHFGDLSAADETVRELCDQPGTTISDCAVALHRLADWQLNIGKNPVAAREALEGICLKYPGTHLDRMARQRINRLPATREELLDPAGRRRIRLPSSRASAVGSPVSVGPEMSEADAQAQAKSCADKLERDPSDVAVRERYAQLLSDHLNRHESGLEQLRTLLDFPDQPEEKRAEWLSRAAEIELRQQKNFEAATELLHELVRQYPRSPQAFPAQRQLSLLLMEAKLRKARERWGKKQPEREQEVR